MKQLWFMLFVSKFGVNFQDLYNTVQVPVYDYV